MAKLKWCWLTDPNIHRLHDEFKKVDLDLKDLPLFLRHKYHHQQNPCRRRYRPDDVRLSAGLNALFVNSLEDVPRHRTVDGIYLRLRSDWRA